MENKIKNLKSKRTGIKSSLTRFKNIALATESPLDENALTELKLRLEKTEPLLEQFNNVQSELEILESDGEVDENERDAFEKTYFEIISQVRIKVTNPANASFNVVHNCENRESQDFESAVKLPPITLPTFNGHYDHWVEFRNSFQALVDSNKKLSNIQKFIYLRSALEKNVLEVIKEIETTEDNYPLVWKILTERYENKKLIVYNHLKAIFEYSNVQKESHTELRSLYDNAKKHLRALKGLGESTETWDRPVLYIITSKFDPTTKRDWESYKTKDELPTMNDLDEFLKTRCELLERLSVTRLEKTKPNPAPPPKRTINAYTSVNREISCNFCGKSHRIYECEDFLKLSVQDRCTAIRDKKLCFNCLLANHSVKNCRANRCNICRRTHNKLLHVDQKKEPSNTPVQETNVSISSHVTDKIDNTMHVVLATALVEVNNGQNTFQARVLLDCGSQGNFMTEALCNKLQLKKSSINHVIKGVGQTLTNVAKQVKVELKSLTSEFKASVNCLILPKITERLPMVTFSKEGLSIPPGLVLADPYFNESREIDMLLGSSLFWSVIKGDQIVLGNNLPIMQESQLGWIVAGNLGVGQSVSNCSVSHFVQAESLENSIQRFWELEEVPNNRVILSKEEEFCERHFKETHQRDESGRFIVRLPFKGDINLGNSRDIARKRFEMLERKLEREPELRTEYTSFMTEYEKLNHMTRVDEQSSSSVEYVMPHHAVVKADSITTKLRVVFDASAKTTSGKSLNELLAVGPKLQQDLFDILVRFRKHGIVMTADISKMYRQILVHENDTKFQKILWRATPKENLCCYELKTVTYGTACAPYLAVKCLDQLAKDNELNHPMVSKIISKDFYMDDLLSGADTLEQALLVQRNISKILGDAGFHLRKWLSNDKAVLTNLEVDPEIEAGVLNIAPDQQNKTLGIYWSAYEDVLQYKINEFDLNKSITKRVVLSIVCQIFDPLGLLGPVIVVAKLSMQELWKMNLDWDSNVSEEFKVKWLNFLRELPYINDFKIPRYISNTNSVSIELHGFSDASERAFGACLYLKLIGPSGEIAMNLICSKSRVAPLKVVSLPRLELCGAELLSKLAKQVTNALDIKFDRRVFWTDSTITLAWIRAEPTKWKTFVANRVSKIQSSSNSDEWHHIRSEDNPADVLSRGSTPQELKDNMLWWHGPQFLFETNCYGKVEDLPESELPEIRVAATSFIVSKEINYLLNKFSNIDKIVRILAYVVRFAKNARLPPNERARGPLDPNELETALNLIVESVQKECFPEDYKNLEKRGTLVSNSKILLLNPFLENKLIRVGGRIRNANEKYDKKHPILLPKIHILTDLIVRSQHEKLFHLGIQALLASIREKYWPISGKSVCKKIVKTCIRCFKVKPECMTYLMGDLPSVRVNEYLPFLNVGTDFAGPLLIKNKKGRGSKNSKAYICLFICMCTKAVHLELVSDLTTEAFIAALQRFVSRRGKPSAIYSDNALNFRGADNEINKIYAFLESSHDEIAGNLASERIKWHFIPARSPNFGGLWEAGIKSCKYHLKRVVGNAALTFEELSTVLCRIEAILNSRPLCPLSDDPRDPTALTPAHLLIGRTLTALPERNVTDIPEGRLSRWQRLQAITQHFWVRWHKEYLAELQTRTKWKLNFQQRLLEGALVLIKEENTPPMNWPLGRVVDTHPGSDGIVRVASVKVRSTVVKRAVNRLCALPLE